MIHINVFIRIWNIMLSFHRNLFFLTNVCYMPFKLPEILGCFPCNLQEVSDAKSFFSKSKSHYLRVKIHGTVPKR